MHIVIIGNGIAGITAARHIRKLSDAKITVISGETDHFFSRTALMYVYMGHMKFEHTKPYEDWFWEKNNIELKKAWVENVDFEKKEIHFVKSSQSMSYDKLILATGSKSNKFGWKGQDLKGVQGLYSYQDLQNLEEISVKAKNAVIVGGGLIGIEFAEMLVSRGIKVTFLVREKSFWNNILPPEESAMINRHILEHHVDLRLEEELSEIVQNQDGRAKAVITKSGETIDCQVVGLTVGVSANVDFLRNSNLELNRGILVNEFLETNVKDVFAAGDCVEHRNPTNGRRAIDQIWYTGRIMGETVAQTICGKPTKYQPGVFFNSAKFFDIEYQTYGTIPADLPEGTNTFYWEYKNGRICVRINYKNDKSKAVTGINTFGIRMKHEVWDKWIREGKNVEYVLENLQEANFDPEFFNSYEEEILEKYNYETGLKLKSKAKVSVWQRIFA
jgi:NAD(P)H-nitrite reductase large subunit